jgi:signal transduction histidine kinase
MQRPESDATPFSHGNWSATRLVRNPGPRLLDGLLALALTGVGVVIVLGRSSDESTFRGDDALGLVLVLVQTVPLAARRLAPMPVLIVISVAVVAHSALGYEQVQAGTFASLIALFTVAAETNIRTSIIALLISVAAVAAFFLTNRGDWGWPEIISTSATWAVAWGAGTFVRLRGEQADVAGARAAQLEREQEVRAREAVADERARMARELHDIVGHALNLIVIQATGASRVFDTRPQVSRDALASIASTGREALSDMERMLGVMRAVEQQDGDSGSQTGLAQLDALAVQVSQAGIAVDVLEEGERRELPASMDLSAYRIVQEALTNCLKHSGASRATVTVRYLRGSVEVEVTDNGKGPSSKRNGAGGGRGLVGMRERVALFGGDLSAGPSDEGRGYRVRARLPLEVIS